MCGVEGAYQLDHKVSIKYGFDNLIPPEIIASVKNLEIITWESNREKSKRNSVDLWDLLE
ncbi:putative head morphogenesis protein [Escherichia phage vB_EcoM_WL-3]|nr:putative head morphogenesis protein [Escherichia phage vB_EcoM_WL-3]